MDDQDFYILKNDIQELMDKLEAAQQKYIAETGKRFISGQGIFHNQQINSDRTTICSHCKQDWSKHGPCPCV
jgi:hypothetical protein